MASVLQEPDDVVVGVGDGGDQPPAANVRDVALDHGAGLDQRFDAAR